MVYNRAETGRRDPDALAETGRRDPDARNGSEDGIAQVRARARANEKTLTDPIVRISVAFSWMRKERKLIIASIVACLIGFSVYVQLTTNDPGPFNGAELHHMSNLPLAPGPATSRVDLGSPNANEDAAFTQLQKDAAKLPTPDLVDGK